jgi:hypothetical protein
MDRRCSLRRSKKTHNRAEARRLTRANDTSLKGDCKLRTEQDTSAIQAAVDEKDPKKAYSLLGSWVQIPWRPPPPAI